MDTRLASASLALLLSACAAPARYDYVKEGVPEHLKAEVLAECQYQVRLRVTPTDEQAESRKRCMQNQGFRLARVS
jgi:hypothetical protein